MNWEGLGDDDDDDRFFESRERISSAVSVDMASTAGSDIDDFEDSRMSFASTISTASSASSAESSYDPRPNHPSMLASYDIWKSEPGDIGERRKRLLQGMGLTSSKDMFRMASTKIARTVSRKREKDRVSSAAKPIPPPPRPVVPAPRVTRNDEPSSSSCSPHPHPHTQPQPQPQPQPCPRPTVLGRSRSDSDIDPFSVKTKQRKEELIGHESKQRLTRTSSEIVAPSKGTVRGSPDRTSLHTSIHLASRSIETDPFFLIKNLDTGKEFIVKEYNAQGMWNKLSDVQTGKQLTMEEFEKSVGQSRLVKELMRRQIRGIPHDGRKFNHNKLFTRSFRNSKRKGAALLKKVAASSKNLSHKEHDQQPSPEEQSCNKPPSQWVKTRHHGRSYRDFTALHVSQEIHAHEGSIWVIRFSKDARFLASAGEDKMIHVWEVQECEVTSTRPGEDFNPASSSSTHVHPMARTASDRPQLAEITPMPSKKKSIINRKKANSIPDYVNVPETVFALSEKPVCTFQGHQDDVLDLSWSSTQQLLSSSMDKTVRLWDLETKNCLKTFAHNDYVTCVQFNPVDDDYFISGSLDAKVRIWNIPDRQVVDWTDSREMVTAASYTPDGHGYPDEDKVSSKKTPWFSSSSPNQKDHWFSGSRNTCSQSSASFSPDGRHVISASEDSQVYIWKVSETKIPCNGKKSKITVQAYEHFHAKDVTVAIAWPGSTINEPPCVEIHSKRHTKLSILNPNNSSSSNEEHAVKASRWRNLPPLAKKNASSESVPNCEDEDVATTHSPPMDPGISASVSYRESSPVCTLPGPRSHSFSSHSFSHHGGQTVQATAWGMVIVTANLEGEITVYQNFGLSHKCKLK